MRTSPAITLSLVLALAACGQAGLTSSQPPRPAAPPVAFNPPPQALVSETAQVRWHQVRFPTASTRVSDGARETIRTAAEAMRETAALRATVIGRADSVGRDQPNLRLSRQRAISVRDALVREGIARERIDVRWTGDRRPSTLQAPSNEEGGDRVVDIALQTRGQGD